MAVLYADNLFLEHRTGSGHPERAERVSHTLEHLRATGVLTRATRGRFTVLESDAVERAHTHELVDTVRRVAAHGGGSLDPDTVVSERSAEVALAAAGAAVAASDAVLGGADPRAFCLIRPPGHHATRNRAMGFCLFNNIAIAAHHALAQHGLERILIVDWDVHHGNGTQDIFYSDPRVLFFSIHRFPFYPGTGDRDETGTGPGLGFTRNEPVAFGTPRGEYLARFQDALVESAKKMRPQLVLISAGFDAHATDPIGSLGLEVEDFQSMTEMVLEVAHEHCAGRTVSILEGGYNLPALARSVEAHLKVLLDF